MRMGVRIGVGTRSMRGGDEDGGKDTNGNEVDEGGEWERRK